MVQIQVVPGVALMPESVFDVRLQIVREADLEDGCTRTLHDLFFVGLTRQEEAAR